VCLWLPSGRQNQNGLVERAWQTITNMGRAFIMDMHMPRNYWYWALLQAVQVHNYVPCTVEPHELVYGVKPDLHILFRMFSTGFFKHSSDDTHHRSGVCESKSMQGIAIGRCRKLDGMLFYCPCTKRIYSSSDYKLDEHRNTPNFLTFDMMVEYSLVCIIHHLLPLLLNHILKVLQSLFLYLLVSLCGESLSQYRFRLPLLNFRYLMMILLHILFV
jgi:hypothetical protein